MKLSRQIEFIVLGILLFVNATNLPADEQDAVIRVMTYNIRYDNAGDGDDR